MRRQVAGSYHLPPTTYQLHLPTTQNHNVAQYPELTDNACKERDWAGLLRIDRQFAGLLQLNRMIATNREAAEHGGLVSESIYGVLGQAV